MHFAARLHKFYLWQKLLHSIRSFKIEEIIVTTKWPLKEMKECHEQLGSEKTRAAGEFGRLFVTRVKSEVMGR